MNKEYQERMQRAEDATNEFFEEVKRTGNLEMLENDQEIREMYFKAFDVASDASDEEKDFYFNLTDYFLYKWLFMLHAGEFAKLTGNRKSFKSKDLKPFYDDITVSLDAAIEQNDRHKSAYLQRKADVIATFNEELAKLGITVQKDGCYIATSVYSSYDCPQVWTLRRYRDGVLAHNLWGRAFIRVYYAVSPTLVKWFGQKKWFNSLWRGVLDTLLCKLQSKGYEDTPYSDLTLQPQQAVHSGSAIKLEKEKKGC